MKALMLPRNFEILTPKDRLPLRRIFCFASPIYLKTPIVFTIGEHKYMSMGPLRQLSIFRRYWIYSFTILL